MNCPKVWRLPLALAILSVVPVSFLENSPTFSVFAFWACVATAGGFAINVAITTRRRYRLSGSATCPVRSIASIIASFCWCLLGFTDVVVSWGYLASAMSSDHDHPFQDFRGFLAVFVLLCAGLLGLCCGASGLFYIERPSLTRYRASMAFGFATFTAILLWSIVSSALFANPVSQSHSPGARLGTFLFVFAIPMIVIMCLVLQLALIRALRRLTESGIPEGTSA